MIFSFIFVSVSICLSLTHIHPYTYFNSRLNYNSVRNKQVQIQVYHILNVLNTSTLYLSLDSFKPWKLPWIPLQRQSSSLNISSLLSPTRLLYLFTLFPSHCIYLPPPTVFISSFSLPLYLYTLFPYHCIYILFFSHFAYLPYLNLPTDTICLIIM